MKLLAIRAARATLDLAQKREMKRIDALPQSEKNSAWKNYYKFLPNSAMPSGTKFGADFTLETRFHLTTIFPDGSGNDRDEE